MGPTLIGVKFVHGSFKMVQLEDSDSFLYDGAKSRSSSGMDTICRIHVGSKPEINYKLENQFQIQDKNGV